MAAYTDQPGQSFSYGQEVALAVIPKITGFFSATGSIWIIVEVLTNPAKRRTVYNRLLFCMSAFDLIVSLTYIASTWPIPVGSPGVIWAIGNTETCSTQGFLNQLAIIPPFYCVGLSVYYLLVIKYGHTEEQLSKYAEPFMHVVALSIGFGTSIASHFLKLYNSADLWCWIAPLPLDCKQSLGTRWGPSEDCVRGDNAFVYRWAFFYVPLWTTVAIVLIVNVATYLTVRKREREARELDENHRQNHERPLPPLPGLPKEDARSFERQRNSTYVHEIGETSVANQINEHEETEVTGQECNRKPRSQNSRHRPRPSFLGFDEMKFACSIDSGKSKGHHRRRPSVRIIVPAKLAEILRAQSGGKRNTTDDGNISQQQETVTSSDIKYVIHHVEEYPTAARQYAAVYHFGSKLVMYQCAAYTLGFYTVWFWSSVNRIVQGRTGRSYFSLLLLQCFFEPLQGLMNAVVYRFGSYLRLRQRNSKLTRWQCFYYSWRWGFMGPASGLGEAGTGNGSETQSKRRSRNSLEKIRRLSSHLVPSSRNSNSLPSRDSKNWRSRSLYNTPIGRSDDCEVTTNSPQGDFLAALAENKSFNDSAEDHINALMADLMTSYTDNPSSINDPLSMMRSEFPIYKMDDDLGITTTNPEPASVPSRFPTILSENCNSTSSKSDPVDSAVADTSEANVEEANINFQQLFSTSDRSSTFLSLSNRENCDTSSGQNGQEDVCTD